MNRRRFLALSLFALTQHPRLSAADDAAKGPRPGKYRIMTYGATNRPPLFVGSFVLGPGTYKAYLPGDKPQGDGRYSFAKTERRRGARARLRSRARQSAAGGAHFRYRSYHSISSFITWSSALP